MARNFGPCCEVVGAWCVGERCVGCIYGVYLKPAREGSSSGTNSSCMVKDLTGFWRRYEGSSRCNSEKLRTT